MELDGLLSTVNTSACSDLHLLTFDPKTESVCFKSQVQLCDLILVKLAPILAKIFYSSSFSGHCLL